MKKVYGHQNYRFYGGSTHLAINPGSHVIHSKDPSVFLQIDGQPPLSVSHSLMSETKKQIKVKPVSCLGKFCSYSKTKGPNRD